MRRPQLAQVKPSRPSVVVSPAQAPRMLMCGVAPGSRLPRHDLNADRGQPRTTHDRQKGHAGLPPYSQVKLRGPRPPKGLDLRQSKDGLQPCSVSFGRSAYPRAVVVRACNACVGLAVNFDADGIGCHPLRLMRGVVIIAERAG